MEIASLRRLALSKPFDLFDLEPSIRHLHRDVRRLGSAGWADPASRSRRMMLVFNPAYADRVASAAIATPKIPDCLFAPGSAPVYAGRKSSHCRGYRRRQVVGGAHSSASLGYPIISGRWHAREIAASMGLTTLQLNEQSAKDRSVDDRIDAYTKMLGETRDHIIVDSRPGVAFHSAGVQGVPSVDPLVGAERVFRVAQRGGASFAEHAVENNRSRTQLETPRFRAVRHRAARLSKLRPDR